MTIPNLNSLQNRLRFRQLMLLLAIHEGSSLRKAAETLGMSQPAATKMLQEVEGLVGLQLFERGRRGMLPTAYGEIMIQYAQGVAADLKGVRDELIAVDSGNIGKIRVGAIMAPVPHLLTNTLLRIKQGYPRLAISIQVDTSDVLVAALLEERLDVVIGRIPMSWDSTGLVFEPIQEEALSIVSSTDSRALRLHHGGLRSLVDFSWVLQAHPSPMRRVIEQAFLEARLALPGNVMETASMLLTSSLVRQSDMLAVMPELVAQHYVERGTLAIVPVYLHQHLPPFGILTRRSRAVRPVTQVFIAELKSAATGGGVTAPHNHLTAP